MSSFSFNQPSSLEDIFQTIDRYHKLSLSELLRRILAEKELTVAELYRKLNEYGYYLSLESLYRYFNPNTRSNRFPPEDFLRAFLGILQLSEEEANALLLFWKHYKLIKKCQCLSPYHE
jgi:hypothetical protein